MLRLCGFGWVGLAMSKGGERASSVALPQPAANRSLCGFGSELGHRGNDGSGCAGLCRLGLGVGRVAQTERSAPLLERVVCGNDASKF